jgi:hypothetical protein
VRLAKLAPLLIYLSHGRSIPDDDGGVVVLLRASVLKFCTSPARTALSSSSLLFTRERAIIKWTSTYYSTEVNSLSSSGGVPITLARRLHFIANCAARIDAEKVMALDFSLLALKLAPPRLKLSKLSSTDCGTCTLCSRSTLTYLSSLRCRTWWNHSIGVSYVVCTPQ